MADIPVLIRKNIIINASRMLPEKFRNQFLDAVTGSDRNGIIHTLSEAIISSAVDTLAESIAAEVHAQMGEQIASLKLMVAALTNNLGGNVVIPQGELDILVSYQLNISESVEGDCLISLIKPN